MASVNIIAKWKGPWMGRRVGKGRRWKVGEILVTGKKIKSHETPLLNHFSNTS